MSCVNLNCLEKIQKKKRELVTAAFKEKGKARGDAKQARLADIHTLLG